MIDLWPRLEPLLARVERPARYLDHEWGSTRKEGADFNYCMVYPDTYELGQPNQAVRILVNAVNATEHLAAERAFLPAVDLIDLMREEGVPMFSLESCAPLSEFDAIGITLPHELAASNVLEVLDLSGLPLRAVDRAQRAAERNADAVALERGIVRIRAVLRHEIAVERVLRQRRSHGLRAEIFQPRFVLGRARFYLHVIRKRIHTDTPCLESCSNECAAACPKAPLQSF